MHHVQPYCLDLSLNVAWFLHGQSQMSASAGAHAASDLEALNARRVKARLEPEVTKMLIPNQSVNVNLSYGFDSENQCAAG